MTHTLPFTPRQRRRITAFVLLAHLANPVLVSAQVILNAGTPSDGRRAYVDQTQSGLTKVNIATPNGAGVSHNSYQQFDVPAAGVILNNGATNSNTRLAGWVEGNPNLRPGQEARLILNEVVGASPSTLQGYLEVAGQRADVVVANERGITCHGCGFINTERITLSTGRPEWAVDGGLARLNVQGGQIAIGAGGLQAADSQVDLLSQHINVQGDIHALRLRALTGAHRFDYVGGQITGQASTAPAAPSGLDVGQLGGMYANQIRLVATGAGVGVRVDGQLLSAGQIRIEAGGTLAHSGRLQADGGAHLQAARLEQQGQILSAQAVTLQAQDIVHTGSTQAQQIAVRSDRDLSNSGQIKAQAQGLQLQAGRLIDNQAGGTLASQGTVTLQAQQMRNAGQLSAAGDVSLQAQQLQQDGGLRTEQALDIQTDTVGNTAQVQARQLQLTAQTVSNSGQLQAGEGGLQLTANAVLRNASTGKVLSEGPARVQAGTLDNVGDIRLQGDSQIQAQSVRNSGLLQGQAALTLQATQLDNAHTLAAAALTLQGAQLGNTGQIQAQQLRLNGQDSHSSTLVNSGTVLAQQIDIADLQALANTGRISTVVDGAGTAQTLTIAASRLQNSGGRIEGRDGLQLQAGQIDNRAGQLLTQQGAMDLRASVIDNRSGSILQQGAATSLDIVAEAALNNASGQIEGQGRRMRVQAGEIGNNSGQLLHTATVQSAQAAPELSLTALAGPQASGQLQNIQGRISASGNLSVQAQAYITDASDKRLSEARVLPFMDKTQATSGSLPAGKAYDWESDIAANEKVNSTQAAADQAAATASSAATALSQAQATLSQAQANAQAAQAAAQAQPSDAALALAAQQAQAALVLAQTGVTVALADKTAADAASASAQAAYQAALAEVKTIPTGSSGNAGSSDSAKPSDLQIATPNIPTLTLPGALALAGGHLALMLGDGGFDNRQGKLQARQITVQTTGDAWTHQISAQDTLSLQARHIEADGLVQANAAQLSASGQFSNSGRIEGRQSLDIGAGQLQNSGTLYGLNTTVQADSVLNTGVVQGRSNLDVDAAQVFNAATLAGGQVRVRGRAQLENTGVVFANTGMTLQGADIVNHQARIHSMGDLLIEGAQPGQAAASVFNYAGRIESVGDLSLSADTLTNRAVLPSVNVRGLVEHLKEDGKIITRATDTFNADGKKAELIAGKSLTVNAKTVHNDYGILSAWHAVNINADTIHNTAYGAIQTENMVVKAACYNCHQTVRYANSWGGVIESGGAARLRALVINNKTVDTRDGFAGLSSDPRVVIVDERSGTQSPLTKAFVDRFGTVGGPGTTSAGGGGAPLPGQRQVLDGLVFNAYGGLDFSRFKLSDSAGLFERADPASPYLIQGRTDLIPRESAAQNTQYNNFLGSDYLMLRLGLLPTQAKRLGDAWYETQLVQAQLFALSGRRYTVAGTSNDYDLMRSLMDAGLLAQAQLALSAGQGLSAEQQAKLTQDIVWPEWQVVDGQRVLVPRVYLAQQADDEPVQVGALIAGKNVQIDTGSLNNSGALSASQSLLINASGQVSGSGSLRGGTSVALVAGSVDLHNASVQSGGWLQLQSTQGDIQLTATQVSAAGSAELKSAGELNVLAQKHEAHVQRGAGSSQDEVKFETSNISAGANLTLQSQGHMTVQGSKLSAGQDLVLASTGQLTIDSPQSYTRTQVGSDVRQSLQTERGQIEAGGNLTLYGQQAVQLNATDVSAAATARVQSQGDVSLGYNTDTEQHNWTTSSSKKSAGGLKKKTTVTHHETVDKTAEVTQITGNQVQVLGRNVVSEGAKLAGRDLVQMEGADQTRLYEVQEAHQYTQNSRTTSSFAGVTYKKTTSTDTSFKSEALGSELTSKEAVRVGVGAVTDVRGAILTAPKVEFYRSPHADPSQSGELILGASANTTQTSHTESKTTAGVWQKQSGQGSTTQSANQTQINGNMSIGQGINTTVQIPEGALKSQIEALSQQPGQGYLQQLASDPKVNWQQIQLAHEQWSYSQQGLTGAGAALLAIAVAVASGGTAAGLAAQMGATGATAAAMTAGMTALASSAAVSLVNNGGDLGQTLKDLGSKDSVRNIALAMVSAGALQGLNETLTIGDQKLSAINAKDSSFAANLGKAVVNNVASASMTSALTGTSLEDNLKTGLMGAVISAGAGQTANTIGDLTQNDQALKALAHALAGCAAGAAGSGSQGCQSGAIGAVVGELAAQWYDPSGTKKPEDTLNFVKVISAAAGALTGDGSAQSVGTAVMTGVNAALNNRLLHFDEKERIRMAAAGDPAKQDRLTKAACFEVKCWAQFPEGSDLYKANHVSVAEMSGMQAEWDWVKGQKNFGAFSYTPSQQFTDWVASNTGMASGTLNGKVLGTGANQICGNGDTGCITGVGQQQNAPLTEAQKQIRAEYFGNLSTEYQRSANLAATMRLPQVVLSYEIAAGVTALLEQAYQPSLGKVASATVLDAVAKTYSEASGVPRLIVDEVINSQIKPQVEAYGELLDKALGYKK